MINININIIKLDWTVFNVDCPGDLPRNNPRHQTAVLFPGPPLTEGPGHPPALLPPAPPGWSAPPLRQLPALQAGLPCPHCLLTPLVRPPDTGARDDDLQ